MTDIVRCMCPYEFGIYSATQHERKRRQCHKSRVQVYKHRTTNSQCCKVDRCGTTYTSVPTLTICNQICQREFMCKPNRICLRVTKVRFSCTRVQQQLAQYVHIVADTTALHKQLDRGVFTRIFCTYSSLLHASTIAISCAALK